MTGGLGSSPFDDEGVATQTTPIIENGILRNYLHSAYTARKFDVPTSPAPAPLYDLYVGKY